MSFNWEVECCHEVSSEWTIRSIVTGVEWTVKSTPGVEHVRNRNHDDRPVTAKGRDTRRRIVETASDLMVERGVSAVSLDEVGRATSTSKSQMYHYFASKDDLVAAVVICVRDRILAFQSDLLDSGRLGGWFAGLGGLHRRLPPAGAGVVRMSPRHAVQRAHRRDRGRSTRHRARPSIRGRSSSPRPW